MYSWGVRLTWFDCKVFSFLISIGATFYLFIYLFHFIFAFFFTYHSFADLIGDNYCSGGSRGRVQGVRTPPLPRDDLRFSNTTGILPPQKTMWFIGDGVEQETSAPPPKKNPGSAPVLCCCPYLE